MDSTQASMGTSSLEPAEASQALPDHLSLLYCFSSPQQRQPFEAESTGLGVKGPGCESVPSLRKKKIILPYRWLIDT